MEQITKQTIRRIQLTKDGVNLKFDFIVGSETFRQIDIFIELIGQAREELEKLKQELAGAFVLTTTLEAKKDEPITPS